MAISTALSDRNQQLCELCNQATATEAYTVSPRSDNNIDHQVALCDTCQSHMSNTANSAYWRCLEGSIWSVVPAVQALSYRLLHERKEENWAQNLIDSVYLEEDVVNWALSVFQEADLHKDAYGNVLENGDNVVLTQALNVKGTNFTAAKGTVVKKIKLVHDNTSQIEGKINEQLIVILTRYVKKN